MRWRSLAICKVKTIKNNPTWLLRRLSRRIWWRRGGFAWFSAARFWGCQIILPFLMFFQIGQMHIKRRIGNLDFDGELNHRRNHQNDRWKEQPAAKTINPKIKRNHRWQVWMMAIWLKKRALSSVKTFSLITVSCKLRINLTKSSYWLPKLIIISGMAGKRTPTIRIFSCIFVKPPYKMIAFK